MFPTPPAVAGPDSFLNQTAKLDQKYLDKYLVSRTRQNDNKPAPIVGSEGMSRLYQYLNGNTPSMAMEV